MNNHKNTMMAPAIVVTILTSSIVIMVFNSKFAKTTVDYFAFFAGIFLISDALFKIISKNDRFFPYQLIRFIRLIIGISIFTIHIMQYIYGI